MKKIHEEDMPLCPGCDQPIFAWEGAEIVQVGQVKALICESCAVSDEEE